MKLAAKKMNEARTTRTGNVAFVGEGPPRRRAGGGVRWAHAVRSAYITRSGRWGETATAVFLIAGLFCMPSASAAPPGQQQAPAPIERRAPPARAHADPAQPGSVPVRGQERDFRGFRGEHLAVWLSRHSNLNLQQQEQALGQEPGFANLPQATQQRYRNRLAQLDAMNPQRRQNMLARNEALERLSPGQRAQVRAALGGLGSLPPEQRGAVAQTFNALRRLPASERPAAFGSGRFGPPLNGPQQVVLINLLTAEPLLGPMLPPRNRPVAPPYPQNFPNGGPMGGPQYPR